MKKLMLSVFFMVGIFVLASQGELLWSSRLLLDESRVHKVQKGESLSLLAKRYYGDPQRWRELALLNRAPNPNLVLPGEEVLVPAVGSINEMSRVKTITKFNSLANEQERLAVVETPEAMRQFGQSTSPSATSTQIAQERGTGLADENQAVSGNGSVEPATSSSADYSDPSAATSEDGLVEENARLTDDVQESGGFPWFWLAVAAIVAGGVFAFVSYRKRAAAKDENAEGETSNLGRTEELFRGRRHNEGATTHA
jgi:hypothetical protein